MFNPHDLSAQVSILLCPHITDPIVQTSVFVYFETTKTLPNKKHFIYIASVIFMILFFLIFRLWKPLHIVDHKQHCRNAPGKTGRTASIQVILMMHTPPQVKITGTSTFPAPRSAPERIPMAT